LDVQSKDCFGIEINLYEEALSMTVLSPGNPPSFDQEQTGAGLPLTVTNIRMEFPDLTVIFRFISASSSYVGASTTSIG